MLNLIIAGILQGIIEWLPVSSEGIISLFLQNTGYTLEQAVDIALFLHFGTLLATISFFYKDLKRIFRPKSKTSKDELLFIIWATFIGLVVGGPLYLAIQYLSVSFGNKATILIGVFLIITGIIQLFRKSFSNREYDSVKKSDGILTGLAQGFAVLPGISRSGSTTLALLVQGFNVKSALKLSFFASIPAIFIAQLVSGIKNGFFFSFEFLIAGVASFIVGRISIKYLLNLAEKINFSLFCILFGLITILF